MDIKKLFQTYYVSALKQYADFKGRTSRKAYWMFVLINMLIGWAIIALDNIIGTEEVGRVSLWGIHNGMFNNFYSLIMILPGIAIAVRRLHDVGKKGSTMFLLFIPVIGWFVVLMELIKIGDPDANEYGPVPPVDPEDSTVSGHPYAPNDKKPDEGFDVSALRKIVEEKIQETKIQETKIQETKIQETKSQEIKKQEAKSQETKVIPRAHKVKWGRDKGAVDFRPPSDRKRSR